MRVLMWFRSDLRMRDNTALHHACKDAERGVVGVFAVSPKQWREHDWGAMKVDFVLRNTAELSKTLGDANIPLLIVNADSFNDLPSALDKLAAKHNCDALYFNREYEVNERRRDEAVTALFQKKGRIVRAFDDQTIFPPEAIEKQGGGFYTVFTPYKRAWCAAFKEQDDFKVLRAPSRQDSIGIKSNKVPQKLDGFDGKTRPDLWKAGEDHAASRLCAFIENRVDNYEHDRDFPAINGTSTISPYLAAGVLSSRQCLDAALRANNGRVDSGKKGVATWISELIWREFYRHILVGFPRVSMNRPFREETDRLPWRYDEKQFDAWCAGRTGVPIVDAAMRQLSQTGWMHNRLRMIVAMFLTKQLFIDWRWGERHFMRHLVDGDLASNNGGWQWSASTGTDAAPYFRIFNPFSQSRRFDSDGAFIRRFVPELEDVEGDAIHEPHKAKGLFAEKLDYPEPIVDHKQAREAAIAAFKAL